MPFKRFVVIACCAAGLVVDAAAQDRLPMQDGLWAKDGPANCGGVETMTVQGGTYSTPGPDWLRCTLAGKVPPGNRVTVRLKCNSFEDGEEGQNKQGGFMNETISLVSPGVIELIGDGYRTKYVLCGTPTPVNQPPKQAEPAQKVTAERINAEPKCLTSGLGPGIPCSRSPDITILVRNECNRPVKIQICLQQSTGKRSCAASAYPIQVGKTFSHHDCQVTGKYWVNPL